MKKLHFIVLFIVTFPTLAQVRIELTNQEILNPAYKFEQLDTSEIITGNLINRSFVFTNHSPFYKDSTDTANYSTWLQLYHEIYSGYYSKGIRLEADSVNALAKTHKLNDVIPI